MLDHHNICWTVDSLREALGFAPDRSRIVSYLPMAHIAERITTHYAGIAFGYEVTTCADIRLLGAALPRERPQILFGVPRTFEKIHSTVQAVLAADPDAPGCSREALEIGARVAELRARGESLSVELAAAVRRRSTPSRCGRRASCSVSTTCACAVTRRGADPGRGAPVLPQRGRAARRSSTGCRSRRGP